MGAARESTTAAKTAAAKAADAKAAEAKSADARDVVAKGVVAKTANAKDAVTKTADEIPLSAAWRRTASVIILLHVTAVFVAPFTFASSPAPGMAPGSPLAVGLMGIFQPYIEATFLQHGYAFFAPDPGPSHLFRVQLEFDDGRPPRELTFPDRHEHWPRLLYHRHFMLSERLNDGFVPSVAPPPVAENPYRLVAWRRSREAYESYYHTVKSAYERHLRHRYGASAVRIVRLEHRLLTPEEILDEHKSVTAPELYEVHPEDLRAEVLP